ncbi:MAG: transglutaminase-like domain-containing protein [Nanoarchaeota archaeon]|nr:transglutaminase-like domain-containing protein [Nanoarchaeota archaeon]MBU0963044.1 transglutaminase-like domain-containing protein [Nanoarchaeota archaeon]
MQLAISSNINIISNGDNPSTNLLIAELSLIPIQTNLQSVSNINYISNPEANVQSTGNKVIYKWDSVKNSASLGLSADVHVNSDIPQIKDKMQFPINEINYSYSKYLEPTQNIDVNDDIRNKANDIVLGENDLYSATFKIANWVANNINYNLSTLTAEAVQKSSWVFENKEGVCDEITNLFISMLRSVGIPARFVSGIAYTNTDDKWGNHGWAEVYFPDYGWVPFDVTYKQYGWIDPSHIVLDYSLDTVTPSLVLSGSMHNSNFGETKISINANLLSKSSSRPGLIRMTVSTDNENVGPSSYIPIRIELQNLEPYYIPIQLRVTKAPALTEDNIKAVLLKPNQKKTIFWTVKIPSDIKKNYLYTTIFEVINSFGDTDSVKIVYANEYKTITNEETNLIINESIEMDKLTYSDNLIINCNPEKKYYYDYEKASLICKIKNIGNSVLKELNVCMGNQCELITLYISESKNVKFDNLDSNKQLEIRVSNDNVDFRNFFTVKSLTDPHLIVSNLRYPDLILYDGIADLRFTLSSEAPVKNIRFSLNGKDFYKLDSFKGTENIIVSLKGNYFYSQDKANLIVSYEDENGYKYSTDKSFLVNMQNLPLYIKFLDYIKNLFQ